MKPFVVVCAVVALGVAACGKSGTQTPPAKDTNTAAGQNPLSAPADYLGGMSKAKNLADRTVDTAALTQAVNLFNAQEGRFPKDLQELVAEGYIGAIPAPPPGSRIVYNPANGQVKIVKP